MNWLSGRLKITLNKEFLNGILLAASGTFLWALSGSVAQYLFEHTSMNAEWFVAVRMVMAGVLVIGAGFFKDGKRNIEIFYDKKDRKILVIFALLGIWFCQYTFYVSVAYTNSGIASVLQSLSRVLILFSLCMQLKRLPKRVEVFAVIGAILGTVLLGIGDEGVSLSTKGLIFGLLSAVGSYYYNTLPIELTNKYGTYQTVGYASLLGGCVFSLFVQPWNFHITFSMETFGLFMFAVIMGTIFAPALYLKGLSLLGAFKGSLIGNTQPIFAMLITAIFLGTSFSFLEMVGTGLILLSIMTLSVI